MWFPISQQLRGVYFIFGPGLFITAVELLGDINLPRSIGFARRNCKKSEGPDGKGEYYQERDNQTGPRTG